MDEFNNQVPQPNPQMPSQPAPFPQQNQQNVGFGQPAPAPQPFPQPQPFAQPVGPQFQQGAQFQQVPQFQQSAQFQQGAQFPQAPRDMMASPQPQKAGQVDLNKFLPILPKIILAIAAVFFVTGLIIVIVNKP